MKNPLISVIIPACNEEKYIDKTLDSVYKSDYKNYEVIVVPNGCTDNTEKVLKNYQKIKFFPIKQAHVSKARNHGAKYAKGSIFVFLDADTHLAKNTLIEIAAAFSEDEVVGTTKVKPWPKHPIASFYMFMKNLLFSTHIYKGTSGIIFSSAYTFKKVKGFDETMKKHEDAKFVRSTLKYASYTILRSTNVWTSTRRYQLMGYFGVIWFWITSWTAHLFGKKGKEYPILR